METLEQTTARAQVLFAVTQERRAQDRKWGEQNHPDGTDPMYITDRDEAQRLCDRECRKGESNWAGILLEEVYEACAEYESPERLRTKLIQVAAVAVAWVEALDHRSSEHAIRKGVVK